MEESFDIHLFLFSSLYLTSLLPLSFSLHSRGRHPFCLPGRCADPASLET